MKIVMVKLFLAGLVAQLLLSGTPNESLTAEFTPIIADVGVTVYRRPSPHGTVDYVQVIDLSQGAAVRLLHGEIIEPGEGEGVYGGDNPLIAVAELPDMWQALSAEEERAFCLTNGQFFSSLTGVVSLSFPVKADGRIVSDGFAIHQFPDQKLMLEIWPHRANIVPFTPGGLRRSTAPNLLVGLSEEAAGRNPDSVTGRLFIGVGQPRFGNDHTTIYIFTSRLARKTEAAEILRAFGAEKVMMLDGGASAQLMCEGRNYIGPGRAIPQTIAVLAGPTAVWWPYPQTPNAFSSCEWALFMAVMDDPDGHTGRIWR